MNRLIMFILLTLGILATSVPGAAQAAEVSKFTGGILSADFSSLDPSDPSECMGSAVSFFAGDGTSGAGKGETTAWISIAIARYNTCTGGNARPGRRLCALRWCRHSGHEATRHRIIARYSRRDRYVHRRNVHGVARCGLDRCW
jgi:hypothetical protein